MIHGTDTGVYPHKDPAKQFAVMVRYGMRPLQAIRTATITASEAPTCACWKRPRL